MRYLLLILCSTMLLFTGCTGLKRPVGESGYQELNQKEIDDLVQYARVIILNEKSQLRNNQADFIRSTEPEVKISYRSDMYGRAIIAWRLEKKSFRLVFTCLLNSRDPNEIIMRYSVMRETPQQTFSDQGYGIKPTLELSREERIELKKL